MKSSKFEQRSSGEISMGNRPNRPGTIVDIRTGLRRRGSHKCGASWALGIVCLALLQARCAPAQTYSIGWYKISGGGGTSSNGQYSVSGTIGQHDAGGLMTGAGYSLAGGFWSLISAVQTAGLPNLTINQTGNSVIVSWPNTGTYTLQQNANLAVSAGWTKTGYAISTSNGTNSISIQSPTGYLFFRLANP